MSRDITKEMWSITPVGFTRSEGSYWLVWNAGSVTTEDLEKRSAAAVEIKGEKVHSFIFNYSGHGKQFRRWDCINGWNKNEEGEDYHVA